MGKKGSKDTKQAATPVTKDLRFAGVHNDPRFRLLKRDLLKVKVDDRFSNEDLLGFRLRAKVDRYGRVVEGGDGKQSDFDKLYKREEESEEEGSEGEGSDNGSESGSEGDDESGDDRVAVEVEDEEDNDSTSDSEDAAATFVDRARGEGISDGSESSESDSDSDSDSTAVESDLEIELENTKPEMGEATAQFAVVNMDWDHILAVDLMAALASFAPKNGSIRLVQVYPSEFGKQRMQQEELEGPPRELFKSKKKPEVELDLDLDLEVDTTDMKKAVKKLYKEEDEVDYDLKLLRRYQLQRLRYYYAVVQCDSVATSQAIYDNVDGTEYELTANVFDLRYVPDGMEFDDEPRDACNDVPAKYKPNEFVTDALQHSKVKLTWDETPAERIQMARRALSQKEIDDMDFKAYLASSSEDEEEGDAAQDLKNKYKSLVGGVGAKNKGTEATGESDVDMEISFTPAGAKTEVDAEDESTLDKYRRKEKERRKRRMDKLKLQKEEEDAAKKASKEEARSRKGKKVETAADEKSRAQLELLMMEEEGSQTAAPHFDMREIARAEKEKKKGKKGKKGKKEVVESGEDAGTLDRLALLLSDPRFQEIFEGNEFAIDPTMPLFKKTATMEKIMTERSKRVTGKGRKEERVPKRKGDDLSQLAEKLKRRGKKRA